MTKPDTRSESANDASPNKRPPGAREDSLRFQFQLYADVYKHHFDLFLKGNVLLLATAGAIAGYLAATETPSEMKVLLSGLLGLGSLVGVFGCLVSLRWVLHLERRFDELSAALGIGRFPLSGAKGTASVFLALSAVFFVGAIVHALLL